MSNNRNQGGRRNPSWFSMYSRPQGEKPLNADETELDLIVEGDAPIFANEDFAIWVASREDNSDRITIQGPIAHVAGGERLRVKGLWQQHPKYGWSFKVAVAKSSLPVNRDGTIKFLTTNLPGIGPGYASAIVDHFATDDMNEVFRILDNTPERLREVKTGKGQSLPISTVEEVIKVWPETRAIRQIATFLYSHDVSPAMANKLYLEYGEGAVDVLNKEPYRLSELPGIGFKKADKIARGMGISLTDPQRIQAGLLWVMEEAEGQGHIFLPLKDLYSATNTQLLERQKHEQELSREEQELVARVAAKLVKEGKFIVEEDEYVGQRVYRKHIHQREVKIAERTRWLLTTPTTIANINLDRPELPEGMTEAEAIKQKIFLPTEEQWSAVQMVLGSRLSILTGGPGVGKTESLKLIIRLAEQAGLEVSLAAPTGKAARKMTQVTQHEAKTIHRLLGWSPQDGHFEYGPGMPLPHDVIVVDEASMLSLDLMYYLLGAIADHTHVLLVGDIDQLPPVGAGKILDDLIASNLVPVTHLSKIFRQAAGSMIITNAHRINKGKYPYLSHAEAQNGTGRKMLPDFYWISRSEADKVAKTVVECAVSYLPENFGHHPLHDVQVLAPMRAGKVGLHVLNRALQERLNPEGKTIGINDLRVGDKVLQTVNDYTTETMNGEIGIIKEWDSEEGQVLMSLDEGSRDIWIPRANMDSYILGYAISIHKSQGSQFRSVVIPISTASYVMNTRNLIYTALTRAQELAVIVGEKKALSMSLQRVDHKKRNTTLAIRIKDPMISGQLI